MQALRFTKPHASQKNGIVEHSFRKLKDGLQRAVLETQRVQQPVDIAYLLINVTQSYYITPHARLGGISPWDVFFGSKPPRITGAVLLMVSSTEDSSGRDKHHATAGAGGSRVQRDGTSISRSRVGRRTAAEIRNLA